jgi:hypothetical protein
MSYQSEKPASPPSFTPLPMLKSAEGAVQRLDTVAREIVVMLPTGLAVFDVPCACAVLLRGEPIKLRVIQPGDQVKVTFTERQGSKIAQMLEVPPSVALPVPGCHTATVSASGCSPTAAASG